MEFRKIEISDKKIFEERVDADTFCENCSGYERVFQVLYCFSEQYNYKIACEGNAIFINFSDGEKTGFFPPIVKYPHEFIPAFNLLMNHLKQTGKKLTMYGLDKPKLDLISSAKEYMMYSLPDRNSYEYLYKPEKLIKMQEYSLQKSNMLKSFDKRNKWEFREFKKEDMDEVLSLLSEWSKAKGEAEGDILPMKNALENIEELGLFCDVLLVGGKIVGVDIGYIARNVGIIMYEKVSKKIFGAGVKIVQEFSKKRFADCKYINRQEDMGDIGLRNSKLSYQPDKFIVKHRLYEI